MRLEGSGAVCETVNHQGHEGTRRKDLRPKALVILGVPGGSVSCRQHRETEPLPAGGDRRCATGTSRFNSKSQSHDTALDLLQSLHVMHAGDLSNSVHDFL